MIVFSLCAMVSTVQSTNCVRMVIWIRSSVSRSMAAVASSRIRILVLRRRALARHTSCLWPTLQAQTAFHCPQIPHCSQPLVLSRSLTVLPKKTWSILLAVCSVSPIAHPCRLQPAYTNNYRLSLPGPVLAEPPNVPFITPTKARAANDNISGQAFRNTQFW